MPRSSSVSAYAIRMIADAGMGLHGLIWASPLGWVEELRPLTSPQPLALLPIILFTAGAGRHRRAHGRLARRRVEHRLRPDGEPAPSPASLRANGLAVRTVRPMVIGWWVAITISGLLYGLIAKSAGATISGSSVAKVFSKLGAPGTGADAVLGVCFSSWPSSSPWPALANSLRHARKRRAAGSTTSWFVRSLGRRGSAAGSWLQSSCSYLAARGRGSSPGSVLPASTPG